MTTPTDSPANLWERQSYDTKGSYQAFCDYRDMGVKRSLRGLHERYTRQSTNRPPTKSWTTISGWSLKCNWQERVEAWDTHEQALTVTAHENARKQIIEDELSDYTLQLDKWREAYDRTQLHERRSRTLKDKSQTTDKDGNTTVTHEIVELIEMEVMDWFQLSKWRDEIAKQGRRALGMPDKITEQRNTGKDGGDIIIRTGMSLDDL